MRDKILREFNKATRRVATLDDTVSNLQRQKDFEVTKLEKGYERKITKALEEKAQLEDYIAYIKKVIK